MTIRHSKHLSGEILQANAAYLFYFIKISRQIIYFLAGKAFVVAVYYNPVTKGNRFTNGQLKV